MLPINEDLYLEMLSIPRGNADMQEIFIEKYLLSLPHTRDYYGNVYVSIGSNTNKVAFTSHIDTVDTPTDYSFKYIVAKDGIATLGEGDTARCLGADCTTGVFIMYNMILNNVEGLYCFFLNEEKGCLGSQYAVDNNVITDINHMISFDRYLTNQVITHQMGTRTCSDEFAIELCYRLNKEEVSFSYMPDDGGVYTDSNVFNKVIPNCTNVSVGYYNQHTNREMQDLNHLVALTDVCIHLDWSDLPIGTKEEEVYPFDDYLYYSNIYDETLEQIRYILNVYPSSLNDFEKIISKYEYLIELEDMQIDV